MHIVRINLENDGIIQEELNSQSKYFLFGGRALTSKIIHDEVPPECNPLGKENKLIFANGLLTGGSFPCSARASIGAKSPLTNGIKEANVGGRPSMMLALHGIRALIFEKISSNLKFILIDDNGIKFKSEDAIRPGVFHYKESVLAIFSLFNFYISFVKTCFELISNVNETIRSFLVYNICGHSII